MAQKTAAIPRNEKLTRKLRLLLKQRTVIRTTLAAVMLRAATTAGSNRATTSEVLVRAAGRTISLRQLLLSL